jgi:hypothetical protein
MLATTFTVVETKSSVERATRIELAFSAWEADVLPLNYARTSHNANHDGEVVEPGGATHIDCASSPCG